MVSSSIILYHVMSHLSLDIHHEWLAMILLPSGLESVYTCAIFIPQCLPYMVFRACLCTRYDSNSKVVGDYTVIVA